MGMKIYADRDWVKENTASSWNNLKDRPFGTEVIENSVVTNSVDSMNGTFIRELPMFEIGDTVKLKVDGVDISLVAYDDDGYVTIGDAYADLEAGTGQLGWQICIDDLNKIATFYSHTSHTVSWVVSETVIKIDPMYLPDIGGSSDIVLAEMTVTEDAEVIDIPITAEMANVFNTASEIRFYCDFIPPPILQCFFFVFGLRVSFFSRFLWFILSVNI